MKIVTCCFVVIAFVCFSRLHRGICMAYPEGVDNAVKTTTETFAPGLSIRLASTGVGSWKEISLSRTRTRPEYYAERGSNQSTVTSSSARIFNRIEQPLWLLLPLWLSVGHLPARFEAALHT